MEYSEYLGKSIDAVLEKSAATLENIKKIIRARTKRQSTTVCYHGLEWRVSGIYTPGHAAVFYLKNGDPGYPAEPSELYDITITVRKKCGESDEMSDMLNDKGQDKLIELALENMDDPDFWSDEEIPYDPH